MGPSPPDSPHCQWFVNKDIQRRRRIGLLIALDLSHTVIDMAHPLVTILIPTKKTILNFTAGGFVGVGGRGPRLARRCSSAR
ncbi:hypothetical protein AHAS_Ahas11G0038900 [Arachis hypogaea]